MSKIKIKNFGPIKGGYYDNDGWIDIQKVMLFIGNQGSGKSTLAKIISCLSWIEKALIRGDFEEKDLTIKTFVKHCTYQNIGNYFKTETLIDYRGEAYSIIYQNKSISVERNQSLKSFVFPKITYVPAERNFISIVKNPASIKRLPSTLYTFLEEYEEAKNQNKSPIKLPIGEAKFEYQKLNDVDYIVGSDYKIKLSEASSGFQSTVPLYIVSRYWATSIGKQTEDDSIKNLSVEEENRIKRELEQILNNPNFSVELKRAAIELLSSRFTYKCFINIVEEPEQNLFPSSQWNLLQNLLIFNNKHFDNKLIMTTHSPYLVNFLSIAILAGTLKPKVKEGKLLNKLRSVIDLDATINMSDIAIYELIENGIINKLPSFEGIPTDNNFLNKYLREGNLKFDELLEIEQELNDELF